MRKIEKDIRERLFAMRDTSYRDFQKKLIPDIEPEKIIGVCMPEQGDGDGLRRLKTRQTAFADEKGEKRRKSF